MEEVVARLRKGDQQAFEELFNAFWDAGLRFVQSFLPRGASGEDIVQEVFAQIWDKRRIFESDQHFKVYFYKALRNNTIKHLTRQKPSEELSIAHGLESDDFYAKIIEEEFCREVMRAISVLPEKRRQVILHAMAGFTVEKIAETLNISVNTVKIHKKKAYATLREELKDVHLRVFTFLL